jgi:hypothetical protein
MPATCDDTAVVELTNQAHHIGMEHLGGDVVLLDHRVADAGNRAALREQLPDTRADRVEAVVHTGFKIEEDGFARELASDDRWVHEELIGRGNIHRMSRYHGRDVTLLTKALSSSVSDCNFARAWSASPAVLKGPTRT